MEPGPSALAIRLEAFANYCNKIRNDRAMHVVWIGHSVIENVKPPDSESYARLTVAGGTKFIAPFFRHADLIGLCRQKIWLTSESDKKDARKIAIGGDRREIICHSTAGVVTKNRMGIKAPIDFSLEGENPFAAWL